jgi:hypothetical protein
MRRSMRMNSVIWTLQANHSSPRGGEDSSRGGEDSTQRRERGDSSGAPRRSPRQNHLPERYKYYTLMTNVMNIIEPLNCNQANEHKEWRDAIKEGYESIIKNDNWELTKLLNNKLPIGSKWLYMLDYQFDFLCELILLFSSTL